MDSKEENTGGEDDTVVLNVAGLKFRTRRGTLKRYPETLLGKLYRHKK